MYWALSLHRDSKIFTISVRPSVPEPVDPCNPSPCGSNAVCQRRGAAAACQCIPEYFGDPYVACRPECTTNAECQSSKACQRLKCVDPCPLAGCGVNAQCTVVNHIPNCVCNRGYIGDPFSACRLPPPPRKFREIWRKETFCCLTVCLLQLLNLTCLTPASRTPAVLTAILQEISVTGASVLVSRK